MKNITFSLDKSRILIFPMFTLFHISITSPLISRDVVAYKGIMS